MTREDALDLKRSLRKAVLTAVIESLRDGLTSKMGQADSMLLREVESRLKSLRLILERVDSENALQVVIDEKGIHILDRKTEFHL